MGACKHTDTATHKHCYSELLADMFVYLSVPATHNNILEQSHHVRTDYQNGSVTSFRMSPKQYVKLNKYLHIYSNSILHTKLHQMLFSVLLSVQMKLKSFSHLSLIILFIYLFIYLFRKGTVYINKHS